MSESLSKPKKIIHIDMDSYYASVEMRDNPQYRSIPLAIGGKSTQRGVLATCNYHARRYGVRSAMATAHAMKLCPDLTVIPGRMAIYKSESEKIHKIFQRYTSLIEPLSLDEAYLDVTDCSLFNGSATLIAEDIRQAIKRELNLTASAGVSSLKFVAKIASDINKPNGICVVTPAQLMAFIKTLPLEKIPGVGKVTIKKLHQLGLYQCHDIQAYDQNLLLKQFGKFGQDLWQRSHGIDERDIIPERVRKSIGVEKTLLHNIETQEQCWQQIEVMYQELERRVTLISPDLHIARQGIKLKFADFTQTTIEHTQATLNLPFFSELLDEILQRQNGREIRLIGLNIGLDLTEKSRQLQLPL